MKLLVFKIIILVEYIFEYIFEIRVFVEYIFGLIDILIFVFLFVVDVINI